MYVAIVPLSDADGPEIRVSALPGSTLRDMILAATGAGFMTGILTVDTLLVAAGE